MSFASSSPLPDLEKAARRAKRMFTRRIFRKPDAKDRFYRVPSNKTIRVNPDWINRCIGCERLCQGRRCRECFQKHVRAKYEAKVRAEDERVKANEAVFLNLIKGIAIMAKTKVKQIPIIRTTSGLRESIFQEMEALRSGESSWQRARSMAMLANTLLDSVKTEVEYHKYVSSAPKTIENSENVKPLGTEIVLGQQAV